MKFDVVLGNPPYQENTEGTSARQIYPDFMDMAYSISDRVILVTPARFLFNAGKTPKKWNRKMLSDVHFKVIDYIQDSSKVFVNTDIKGGISITYRDENQEFEPIVVFTPHKELRSIMGKVKSDVDRGSLSDVAYSSVVYKLSENIHLDNPNVKSLLSKGNEYEVTTNIFDKLPNLFLDDKPEDVSNYVRMYGRARGVGRVYKWVKDEYIVKAENFNKWKVFLPKSNGSGALGEVLSTPLIGQPLIGHTQTFMSFGSCDSEKRLLR